MYDATGGKAHNIPANAEIVLVKIDGTYLWTAAEIALFPNALKPTVTIEGNDADVADVETGAMEPQDAPGWALFGFQDGKKPTVYVEQSNWQTVIDEFNSQGVAQPNYIIAAYETPPQATMIAGAIAHQYEDNGLYDLSVVADYWPGVDPTPAPVPEEDDLKPVTFAATVVNQVTGGPAPGQLAQFFGDGVHFRWVNAEQYTEIMDTTWPAFSSTAPYVFPTAVGDPLAFGYPQNATTATMLGLPFP
jgi:hypothetical protein